MNKHIGNVMVMAFVAEIEIVINSKNSENNSKKYLRNSRFRYILCYTIQNDRTSLFNRMLTMMKSGQVGNRSVVQ